MKVSLPLLFIFILSFSVNKGLFAQLDDGKLAPFWEVTDLNNEDWTLEEFLEEGKHVILDFSATWCGICWNYHQTDILDDLNQEFGPAGSDELQVFMFEASWNTNDACCYGQSGCSYISQGNWTNVSYPVVNLEDEELDLFDAYQISYFPTLYIINGDHQTIWEIGQASNSTWEEMITESFSLEVDIELSPGTCDIGQMTVSATGGSGDLSYKWSTGEETTTITAPSGYYDVTVEDDNGYFVRVLDIELENDPDEFLIEDEDIEDVSCFGGNDGSIHVEIESSGTVEYDWFNGSDDEFVVNLPAGIYDLTVTNPLNDCVEVFEFEIEEPDVVTLEYTIDQSTCGEENGVISIDASGGNGGFMYDFGNGFTDMSYADSLAAGTYTVLVSDDNDCLYPLSVSVDSSMSLSAQLEGDFVLTCDNQTSSIYAIPNLSGNISYSWLNQIGDTLSTDTVFNVSDSGIYYLHLQDTLTGCLFIDTIDVLEYVVTPYINLSGLQDLNCEVDSVVISYEIFDTIEVNAIWSFMMDGNDVVLDSEELVVSEPGIYLLTVTNVETGCYTEIEFEITESIDSPTAYFTSEVNDGIVNILLETTGGNLIENWSLDGESIVMSDNYQLSFTENGVYELCLSVQNECGQNEYCDSLVIDGLVLVDEWIHDEVNIYLIGEQLMINTDYFNSKETRINIYSLTGQLIYSSSIAVINGEAVINLEHLMSGVLLVELIDENHRNIQQVFKKY